MRSRFWLFTGCCCLHITHSRYRVLRCPPSTQFDFTPFTHLDVTHRCYCGYRTVRYLLRLIYAAFTYYVPLRSLFPHYTTFAISRICYVHLTTSLVTYLALLLLPHTPALPHRFAHLPFYAVDVLVVYYRTRLRCTLRDAPLHHIACTQLHAAPLDHAVALSACRIVVTVTTDTRTLHCLTATAPTFHATRTLTCTFRGARFYRCPRFVTLLPAVLTYPTTDFHTRSTALPTSWLFTATTASPGFGSQLRYRVHVVPFGNCSLRYSPLRLSVVIVMFGDQAFVDCLTTHGTLR